MSHRMLLASALAVVMFTSCSSVYKTGQTPDDVYFSPTRLDNGDEKKRDDERDSYASNRNDDNYLRMKSRDRRRWGTLDDNDYWYNYDCSCRCNNTWESSRRWTGSSWNSWVWNTGYGSYYNGWGYGGSSYYYVREPRNNTGPKPSMSGYTNRTYSNTNNRYGNGKETGGSNSTSGFGKFIKTIFSGTGNSGSSSSDSYGRPVRTFDGGSSSSGSSSSGNSSSGRSSTGSSSSSGRSGRGGGNP